MRVFGPEIGLNQRAGHQGGRRNDRIRTATRIMKGSANQRIFPNWRSAGGLAHSLSMKLKMTPFPLYTPDSTAWSRAGSTKVISAFDRYGIKKKNAFRRIFWFAS